MRHISASFGGGDGVDDEDELVDEMTVTCKEYSPL